MPKVTESSADKQCLTYSTKMRTLKIAFSLIVSISFLAHSAIAISSENLTNGDAQALVLISDTADRICARAADGGSTHTIDASGSLNLELSGLLRRLVKAGTNVSVAQKSEVHNGVLQSQVLDAARDSNQCKTHVFDVLTEKLLTSVKGVDSHKHNSTSAARSSSSPISRTPSAPNMQTTYGADSPAIGTMNGGTINLNGK